MMNSRYSKKMRNWLENLSPMECPDNLKKLLGEYLGTWKGHPCFEFGQDKVMVFFPTPYPWIPVQRITMSLSSFSDEIPEYIPEYMIQYCKEFNMFEKIKPDTIPLHMAPL